MNGPVCLSFYRSPALHLSHFLKSWEVNYLGTCLDKGLLHEISPGEALVELSGDEFKVHLFLHILYLS